MSEKANYDSKIKLWHDIFKFFNLYKDIIAPRFEEDLFVSDFIALKAHKKVEDWQKQCDKDLLKALEMINECLNDGISIIKDDPIHKVVKEQIKEAKE